MSVDTLVALIVGAFACLGVAVSIIVAGRARSKVIIDAAVERGKAEQRMEETEKDVTRAHRRISDMREVVQELREMAAADAEAHKAMQNQLDKMTDLLMDHLQAKP